MGEGAREGTVHHLLQMQEVCTQLDRSRTGKGRRGTSQPHSDRLRDLTGTNPLWAIIQVLLTPRRSKRSRRAQRG